MDASIEQRLFVLADAIRGLLVEAKSISEVCWDSSRDIAPYQNLHKHLAEAGLACCAAIEQEREVRHEEA